jgi:hypothetical protein
MISEHKLLEMVLALNAEDSRKRNPNDVNGCKDNYVIVLDKNGNLAPDNISALKDGVGIFRDTQGIWGLTIRPAAVYGKPMRYRNPIDLVVAARTRKHGPNAFFLSQGEVRRLRNR